MRRPGSRRLLIAIAAVALPSAGGGLALAAVTSYRHRDAGALLTRFGVDVMATFTADGNPSLVANFSPNGALATPRWSTCPPRHPTSCVPSVGRRQFLEPGPTPAGTVFEARARYRGRLYTARTATWLGAVHATTSPTLSGVPSYGHAAVAHAGTWAGGWQTTPGYTPKGDSSGGRAASFDVLSVEACRTRAGADCVNLTAQGPALPFSSRAPILGAGITGRYLFAFDERSPSDGAYTGVGYLDAAAIPPLRTSATVTRSPAVGPVRGPARPTVSVLPRAHPRGGEILVARVHCAVHCHVYVSALGRRVGAIAHTTITGTHLVGVPRGRMQSGPLKVTLFVSDGAAIRGTSRLRPGPR